MNGAGQIGAAKAWQRNKALAQHDALLEVKRLRAGGMPLRQAAERVARDRDGQLIDAAAGRTLSLSEDTLVRLWYKWDAAGHSIACLLPAYGKGNRKMPPDLIVELQRLCTMDGCDTNTTAIKQLKRDWARGQDIPGLGDWRTWWVSEYPGMPLPQVAPDFPFSDRTLHRYSTKGAERTLGNKGRAAAAMELPSQKMDYSKLRPGELYVFDDVRLDIACIDDITGRPTEMVAYIAYEAGCRYIPAFCIRPANAMKKSDVDELVVNTLQTCGLNPDGHTYLRFERGTLTMSPDAARILEQVTDALIRVIYTGMDAGRKYPGAPADAGKGHWMGKAVIESLMRKLHLGLMELPGQRGNHYKNQPDALGYVGHDKDARLGTALHEAQQLAAIQNLTGGRVKLNLGLLYASQAAMAFRAAIKFHNEDRGHDYQGFSKLKVQEVAPGVWEDITP